MVDPRTYRISSILATIAVAVIVGFVACPGHKKSGGVPQLLSIEVTPTNPTIALGTTLQFTATGLYADGTAVDLTAIADWTSEAAGTISTTADSRGLATGLGVGSTAITASYSGVSASATLTVSSAALVSIEVTPASPQIALGTSQQFAATGIFTDGTVQDLTGQVAWESSAAGASTISNEPASRGLALSVGLGDTIISATLAGVSGATTLSVSGAVLVSVEVTPANPAIALGTNQRFAATGTFSDGTVQDLTAEVVWASSAAAASVSNTAGENGLAESLALGSATISATHAGVSGATTLTVSDATLVSLAITPADPVIALGTTQAFTATGTFTDGSVQDLTGAVTWASSEESVAAIANGAAVTSGAGLASSIALGTTTISAEYAGVGGSTTLAVSSATLVAVEVTPGQPSAALGTTQDFVATGIYTDGTTRDITAEVTWSTSDATVATVSNAGGSRGLATTGGVGSVTITATLDGKSGSTTLTVSDADLVTIAVSPDGSELAMGTSRAFTALGLLTDGTRQDLTGQVTWSSSDDAIATVSNAAGSRGLVEAVGVGSVTISASLAGVAGSVALEVSAATLVSIDVSPFAPSIAKGTQLQLTALGNYSDASTQDLTSQVVWTTSDGAIAAISNAAGSQGLVTGVGVGTATISAGFAAIVESGDVGVTAAVLDSLLVTPVNPSVPVGMTRTFRATGIFSDAGTQDVSQLVIWSSSDPAVATISNAAGSKGLAQGVGSGTTVITATSAGKSVTTILSVSAATLVSIAVGPVDPFLPSGYSLPLQALGTYSDGSTTTLTSEVLWSSSNPGAATISNSTGSEGRVTGVAGGTTTLSATVPTGSATTFLTVTNESLTSIVVAPDPVSLALGETQQMTATGTFSGGTVLDLTSQVRWTVTPRSVAMVGNSIDKGSITTRKAGNTTIRASKGNRTGTASLSVY